MTKTSRPHRQTEPHSKRWSCRCVYAERMPLSDSSHQLCPIHFFVINILCAARISFYGKKKRMKKRMKK